MDKNFESHFMQALLDPGLPVPPCLVASDSERLRERFGVYRNNVMVGLIGALAARFTVTQRLVGEDFFTAMARVFATRNPPCSALMMFYGDGFPDFIAEFEPAASVPYLADVARLEAARTRAYHAADAVPVGSDALAAIGEDDLPRLRINLHPSLEIIASPHPIVTIWAMNSGEAKLAPIAGWFGEDALVMRPHLDVEVRKLAEGGRTFLESLAAGMELMPAAQAALADCPSFDLPSNLANLFSLGLVTGLVVAP